MKTKLLIKRRAELPYWNYKKKNEKNESSLRDLEILIVSLIELFSLDDLLILCPTDNLHVISFHALRLKSIEDRQIFIERNFIAYCANLINFVRCCCRADSSTLIIDNKRLLAVYEWEFELENKNRQRSNNDERRQIYTFTDCLAKFLKSESFCEEKITMQNFKKSFECANLVHFFDHCDFASEFIAKQSLCIFDEREKKEEKNKKRNKLTLFSFRNVLI